LSLIKITDNIVTRDNIISLGNKYVFGNIYLGARGAFDNSRKDTFFSLNIPLFYDQVDNKWVESVNSFNPFYFDFYYDSKKVNFYSDENTSTSFTLNLDEGLFIIKSVIKLDAINTLTFISTKLISYDKKTLLLAKYEFFSTKSIEIKIVTGIDIAVYDINGPHLIDIKTSETSNFLQVSGTTTQKHLEVKVLEKCSFSNEEVLLEDDLFVRSSLIKLEANTKYTYKKMAQVFYESAPNTNYLNNDFDIEFNLHISKFREEFLFGRVIIESDKVAQLGIDYVTYSLTSLSTKERLNSSIPARGISGQTYKGAIFWDTEMFLFPYYLNVDVLSAKEILMYRLKGLKEAKNKAISYNYQGAFYAWESVDNGIDGTSDYNVTDVFTNRPLRTYFKDKQIHINASIVRSFVEYYDRVKDNDLLFEFIDVLIETSIFYASYADYKPFEDKYHIKDVLGPDEYHERVNDNYYTSESIRFSVLETLKTLEIIKVIDLKKYEDLIKKYNFDIKFYNNFANKISHPNIDSNYVIEQFDGYFKLDDISVVDLLSKRLDDKEYLGGKGLAGDTKIIKQADVALMLTKIEDKIDKKILEANYNYYFPRTEHGSSLSLSSYGLLATSIGKLEDAYHAFIESSYIDILGKGKNFAGSIYIGGSHVASLGGAYMILIYGFCGLKFKDNKITLDVRLPKKIDSICFNLIINNKKHNVYVDRKGYILKEIK
jgi:kojibiose phosphorylase/nigerose phosphorylase